MVTGISVEQGLCQRLADGTALNADVYAPAAPGRYPTLLMRLPYGTEIASSVVLRHPSWYATQGFCVVVQDVRGTGRSAGTFYPLRDERCDTMAAIEWAASQPRSNGRVGMYGFSYQAAVQLQAAAHAGDALACIAPCMASTDFYNGWHYEGGVPLYGSTTGWALQLAGIAALHDGRDEEAAILRRAVASIDALFTSVPPLPDALAGSPFARDWFQHETDGVYWDALRIEPAPGLPAFWSGGWYDTFLNGTLNGHRAAGLPHAAPQSLLIGPWLHLPWTRTVGQHDFGPEAWSPLDTLQVPFFKAHLAGETPPDPLVLVFITGLDRWRRFPAWPPAGVTIVRLELSSDGDAGGAAGGRLAAGAPGAPAFDAAVHEPLAPTPSLGGHGSAAGSTVGWLLRAIRGRGAARGTGLYFRTAVRRHARCRTDSGAAYGRGKQYRLRLDHPSLRCERGRQLA